jgi:hypothetical protein
MYHTTTFTSGHTIHAGHIERPLRPFEVQWQAPALRVHCNDGHGLEYAAGARWSRVLAETEAGAIAVARYHYPSGNGFEMRQGGAASGRESGRDQAQTELKGVNE